MNIVGTPCNAVQRSASTALSTSPASNPSLGNSIDAEWLTHANTPITIPNVWNSGTGMQSLS